MVPSRPYPPQFGLESSGYGETISDRVDGF